MTDAELLAAISDYAQRCLGPRRAAIVNTLVPLVGLDPSSPVYQAKLYHDDPPSRRSALAVGSATEHAQSGCGVTVEYGLVEGAGVKDPRFRLGFDVRGARGGLLSPITLQMEVAKAAHCWHDTTVHVEGDSLPLEADNVVVGLKGGGLAWNRTAFATEHTATIALRAELPTRGPRLVHVIEGGQPGIRAHTRALVEVWTRAAGDDGRRSGELWLANVMDDGQGEIPLDADGRPHVGRRVLGWCDVDGLDCAVE